MERIECLKEKMLAHRRHVSIEQARIITKSYQAHENEPRILQRAYALAASLREIEIGIEPEELIVGNRTKHSRDGVVFPESGISWVDQEWESLPTRAQDPFDVYPEDVHIFRQEILPYWKDKSLEDIIADRSQGRIKTLSKVVKVNQTDHAQGHICPNLQEWLAFGPTGLAQKASDSQFGQAVKIVMAAASDFMLRYANLAKEMKMDEVASVCEHLAYHPAENFHQALQSTWFLMVILHMESNASSFSPGRLDQILWPYYQADDLSQERALELIECLWLKFNQIVYLRNAHSAKYFAGFPIGFNIALGGQDEKGKDASNELSFLFLQAQEDLGLPQPNLSVRLFKNTDETFLRKAVKVVSKGSGMPQFFNDEAIVDEMIRLGIDEKSARDYAIVGCVELTTQGNNLGWSDAAMFNLNKVLELCLHHGKDLLTGQTMGPDYGGLDTYASFEALEQAYGQMIDYYLDQMTPLLELVEQAHIDCLPTPFLSAVIDDCLAKDMDVTAGGAHYNLSGIQMIQVANLADSLAAIKQLVYEQKQVSASELMLALQANFAGYESLRQRLLNKVPKYGNDVAWVDELGAKWARYFRKGLERYQNLRKGPYHSGMYTVSAHVPMGQNVGASADGRTAKEPLADGGMSAVYGRDIHGPTAVLKSVSRLDSALTTNGGLLNMKFLPSFFEGEHGIETFANFLRVFVDLKIPHIQFNVVDKEMLLDAKAHPERYGSLTVRVAGYTAYFTELASDLQDEIIARTAYGQI